MTMAARLRRPDHGFTLVELLLALTLLGLLSAMVFGGLRFGARSWEATAERSEARDRVALTQQFLRRMLTDTPGRQVSGPQVDPTGRELVGTPGRVNFVAAWPHAVSTSTRYRFTLRHDREAGGRLLLDWRPATAAFEAEGEAREGTRVLLEGVAELSFAYFGRLEEGTAARWHAHWPDRGRPPERLALDLAFRDATPDWPQLVVAIRQ